MKKSTTPYTDCYRKPSAKQTRSGQHTIIWNTESQRDNWSFCLQESLRGIVGPSVPRRLSDGQLVLLSPGESQRDSRSFFPQENLRGTVGPSVPRRVRKYCQTKGPIVPSETSLRLFSAFQKGPLFMLSIQELALVVECSDCPWVCGVRTVGPSVQCPTSVLSKMWCLLLQLVCL